MIVGFKKSRRRDDAGIAIYRAEITSVNKVVGEHSPPQLEIQPAQFTVLNERWRVRLNDSTQWILARQQGCNTDGSPRYRDRSFCTQRRTLLRDIHDYCGDVDPNALAQVETLPERFPYRAARRA